MAKRTPAEVYAQLLAAGWPPDLAVTMTAIAGAESGYRDDALGDQNLQDNTWGPSYGLYQIRTYKADTGKGTDRDIRRLATSDLEQARAAKAIYDRAGGFTPWTVYRTGAYRAELGAAQAAAASSDDPFPTWGPTWLPWNWPSDAGNAAAGAVSDTLGGVRHIALEFAAGAAAAVLIVAGLYMLAAPVRTRLRAAVGL